MFSTLSSFLPSALQQSSEDKRQPANDLASRNPGPAPKPSATPASQESAPNPSEAKPQADNAAGKRKRNTQETFIVVRPPPAKSNHPLNLQVQLVPPQARDRSFRRSVEYSAPSQDGHEDPNALTRTTSNRSDTSMYSGYSSVSSFSSVASSSSSRRMIIPLYNLQAHNVMTNTIVDAGTDAKVAKLSKRGLELLGLALLEPVEVFGTHSSLTVPLTLPPSARTSFESRDLAAPALSPSPERPHTPNSFISSEFGAHDATPLPVHASLSSPAGGADATPTGSRRIFGRLFKRKDVPGAGPGGVPPPTPASPTASLLRVPKNKPTGHAKRGSVSLPDPEPPSPALGMQLLLQPAVLGIQPVLSSPVVPPRGRPHSYAWIVRRWIKGAEDGLLAGVAGFMGLSEDRRGSRAPEEGAVEVQFIWARGKAKAGSGATPLKEAGSHERDKRRGLVEHPSVSSLGSGRRSKRNSVVSTATGSTRESDEHGAKVAGDDGDESDPEDSETPWTCTLVLRRLGAAGPEPVRLKVATFSPTPHHPKVVALLKVPFPLPDVVVDRLLVHRRVVSPQGLARPGYDSTRQPGLVLTAEEIKDVVCSTGLWLVVRESIGGVGKVNRKGDGWRIRA
ncbi:hypothetical protein K488DRAFT_86164 [Vararia minispora EC-137]|uniref:Uncharacterized protein n=1 Tax=Vararia minispora EC-137 TaxID=1314806 RepID=A0ACB8QKA2_9AGAM|nr:hypothetical protein K488DRAFT_86164 [Vararia minispora EC-137]